MSWGWSPEGSGRAIQLGTGTTVGENSVMFIVDSVNKRAITSVSFGSKHKDASWYLLRQKGKILPTTNLPQLPTYL